MQTIQITLPDSSLDKSEMIFSDIKNSSAFVKQLRQQAWQI